MVESSRISLKREQQYADSLRKYTLFLDGKESGTISKDEEKKIQISPGKHNIELKIDWCTSNKLEFEIKPNQKLNFFCGSNLKGFKLFFLSLLYITIWTHDYLYIKLEK
jgi:hypothetical protein